MSERTDRSGGTARPRRAGVVLAGGFSTRFGDADKALAPVAGTPMLRRVVERVGRVADAAVVNCRADQRSDFAAVLDGTTVPVAFALDPVEDAGPLAGLAAGLAVHDAPETVAVACDVPQVDPDFLADLCERRRAAGADAAVPVLDGAIQPAQVALATGPARRAAAGALTDGRASLRSLLDRLDAARVDAAGARESLRDVDERADLPEK